MSAGSSRNFSGQVGDWLRFTGYVKATSKRPLSECVYALRANRDAWMGGRTTRLVMPKSNASKNEWRFEIEYFHLRAKSGRRSHVAQRLKGVMYQDGGQTHVAAKVFFTRAGMMWLWLAAALTAVTVGILIYTGNVVAWLLIALTGSFMVGAVGLAWFERYRLVRLVRRSMRE